MSNSSGRSLCFDSNEETCWNSDQVRLALNCDIGYQ
uniref:Uncharacterized protein n=1 Tax=Anguilla anguilla TaxID=7936 RepID=A0A0E9XE27_ANGAN